MSDTTARPARPAPDLETVQRVDAYLADRLLPEDPALDAVLAANAEGGLPAIDVSPLQGALLELLVRMAGARRVLEVGTLGGYSTTRLARGLPAGGSVLTCEVDPHHADVARANLERAGVADRVEVRVGPAVETLRALPADEPFDLVFVDADKPSNPDYLEQALRLTRPGSVLVVDNVVRRGAVADPATQDAGALGTRRFFDLVADEPRLQATALQTVGAKGWDGLCLALVVDPGSSQGSTR